MIPGDESIKEKVSLPPVVFIHGMWCNYETWLYFVPAFEAAGFKAYAPDLRYHSIAPGAPPPDALGSTSLTDYVNDLVEFIKSLDEKPILVGHSMGGLLAQILASKGAAKAAILLAPAAPAGIFALRLSVLKIFLPMMLRWGFWRKPTFPSYEAVRWGVLNEMSEEEARMLYRFTVWESGRATSEIALWPLDSRRASAVPVKNVSCPLLVIAGAKDRITPASVCRKVAQRYGELAEYREYPGHAHWLPGEPGWENIAQDCIDWAKKKSG